VRGWPLNPPDSVGPRSALAASARARGLGNPGHGLSQVEVLGDRGLDERRELGLLILADPGKVGEVGGLTGVSTPRKAGGGVIVGRA
jgi:hypothetical protein